jgi:hypothetical protein
MCSDTARGLELLHWTEWSGHECEIGGGGGGRWNNREVTVKKLWFYEP